eukprot:15453382-Alexandrium_andersonii.AAC.1
MAGPTEMGGEQHANWRAGHLKPPPRPDLASPPPGTGPNSGHGGKFPRGPVAPARSGTESLLATPPRPKPTGPARASGAPTRHTRGGPTRPVADAGDRS